MSSTATRSSRRTRIIACGAVAMVMFVCWWQFEAWWADRDLRSAIAAVVRFKAENQHLPSTAELNHGAACLSPTTFAWGDSCLSYRTRKGDYIVSKMVDFDDDRYFDSTTGKIQDGDRPF